VTLGPPVPVSQSEEPGETGPAGSTSLCIWGPGVNIEQPPQRVPMPEPVTAIVATRNAASEVMMMMMMMMIIIIMITMNIEQPPQRVPMPEPVTAIVATRNAASEVRAGVGVGGW
jgi:hypothetical protein